MHLFCGILAVICLLYYILVASYAGVGSAFIGFWLAAAASFGILAFMFWFNTRLHFIQKIPRPIIISVVAVVMSGVILVVFLFGCVVSGMFAKPQKEADFIIVLGAQIRGTWITKPLRLRLDKALEYYLENSDSGVKIIVSGGQGAGEDYSESYAMKQYLVAKGVPEERIIMEDKSTTTKENLEFSYDIICREGNPDCNVVICSNNFHIFRARELAKHMGMVNVEGLAADCDIRLLPNYMVRDSLAIFKEFLLGNLG